MAKVQLFAKGQVVIPAPLRKKVGIKPGDRLEVMEYNGIIYLIPPVADPVDAACGFLPGRPSLTRDLLRERKKDSRR